MPKRFILGRNRGKFTKEKWAKISPEERSRIIKDRMAKILPEERSRIARERNRSRWAKVPLENRGDIGKKVWKEISSEERSRIIKERVNKLSSEERSRIAMEREAIKGQAKRSDIARVREANKGPEKRSLDARKRWAQKSFSQRKEIMRKVWEAGRRKIEEKLAKINIDHLPNLGLLTWGEETMFLEQYYNHLFFDGAVSKEVRLTTFPIQWFYKRPDYDDVKQEFRIAILIALRKWDRKMNLDILVNNSVMVHMYEYFAKTNKYNALMSYLEEETAERVIAKRKTGRTPKSKE